MNLRYIWNRFKTVYNTKVNDTIIIGRMFQLFCIVGITVNGGLKMYDPIGHRIGYSVATTVVEASIDITYILSG